jgi:hypothetical protein
MLAAGEGLEAPLGLEAQGSAYTTLANQPGRKGSRVSGSATGDLVKVASSWNGKQVCTL